ncbi:putative reverse transcriptase domain-containing protein [Tanacetum coccineum]
MAPKTTTRPTPATTTTTTIHVTNAQLKELIDQGVADALAARDADRSRNGDDSHNSGAGSRRIERTILALTWWNTHVKTVGHDATYGIGLVVREIFLRRSDNIEEYVGENKRKQDNNQQQQPQNKRQNTGRAYAAGTGEKKLYGGSKPLCPKSPANANTANNQRGTGTGQKPTCYECGAQGHFKRECPKLKNNKNRGNTS